MDKFLYPYLFFISTKLNLIKFFFKAKSDVILKARSVIINYRLRSETNDHANRKI